MNIAHIFIPDFQVFFQEGLAGFIQLFLGLIPIFPVDRSNRMGTKTGQGSGLG